MPGMAGWREALNTIDLTPRPTQERALAAVEAGVDLVVIDRTGGGKRPALYCISRKSPALHGSRGGGCRAEAATRKSRRVMTSVLSPCAGKSLTFQLPAALAWMAGALDDDSSAPPPIGLVVVPTIALGEDQRERAQAFLARLKEAGVLRRAAALFVERGDGAAPKPKPKPKPAAVPMEVVASQKGGWPNALPCGQCDACRGIGRPPVLSRLAKVPGVGGAPVPCCWTCRVSAPEDKTRWCAWCRERGKGNGVKDSHGACAPRAQLLAKAELAEAAAAPVAGPRTRRGAAEAAAGGSEGGEARGKEKEEEAPVRLSELPSTAPERLIIEDSELAVVVATSSALTGEGARARLLREALARRRVSLVAIDECDTVGENQMAGMNPSLARLGTVLDQRDAAAPSEWPRPLRVALSGTLPPVARAHVLRRLRLDPEARVVRSSIDRGDITYYRVPLQWHAGEGAVAAGVRALKLVRSAAPPWVREGRAMIFCTLAATAEGIAAALRRDKRVAWAYASRTMSRAERDAARREWAACPNGIIVCTDAFGRGVSTPDVRLVLAYEYAADPTSAFQHLGRAARDDGERGVAALCMSGRFAVERLTLLQPSQNGGLDSFMALLAVLFRPGCLRAALLREFGEGLNECAGCDDCCVHSRCAKPACGALLPELLRWVDGREAACALLESLREEGERSTLAALLHEPTVAAPAPFNEATGHHMLVLALLAAGVLLVKLLPHPHLEHGSLAYVREADGGLRGLRCGGSPLLVPLPTWAVTVTSPVAAAAAATTGASRQLSAAAAGQEIATLVGDARQLLLQADELLQRSVIGMEMPLRELELCPRDLALVQHTAAAAAADGDGGGAAVGGAAHKVAVLRAQLREAEAQLGPPGPPPTSPARTTAAPPPASPALATNTPIGDATFAVPALPRTQPAALSSSANLSPGNRPLRWFRVTLPSSELRAVGNTAARAKRSPSNIAATPSSGGAAAAQAPSAPRCMPIGGGECGSEQPSRGRANTLGVQAKRREVGGSPIRLASGVAAAFEVAFDDPYDEERQIEQEDLQRSRALGWEPPASPEYYCETGP